MLDWIKNLEPEFLIIFVGLLLAFIINIFILIKSSKTLDLIGKRAFKLNEDLVIRSDKKIVDILISNTSFISVKVAAVGYIFKKNLLPISEEITEIAPRDSIKISIEIDALKAFIFSQETKLKRLKIYVEDTLGRRTLKRAKDSYRALKKMIKEEKKAQKLQAKIERFNTGKYNFIERVGLVFKFIFSPFSKLNYIIKKGLNKRLKEREVKLKLMKKEREHTAFLKSIAEDDRRDKELFDLENKIALERSEIEKQQQVKHEKFLLEKKRLADEMAELEAQKELEKQEVLEDEMANEKADNESKKTEKTSKKQEELTVVNDEIASKKSEKDDKIIEKKGSNEPIKKKKMDKKS
ncbi:hypothetical protein [Mariniplasma anaerobium]|uniref:Uncharacterized protein n=1 Tax=Mariniplasma anaerobium TaxID=2735436 RepID=A0A7U9TIH9_9MOLU|nr:hypothetical protein [Mariniplasma anaerobium]BCR36005.1 hypothetical protein MPAN_008980 [Mariniplasma anaerobium]